MLDYGQSLLYTFFFLTYVTLTVDCLFCCILFLGLDTPCPDKNIFFSPCPEESDRDLSEINREINKCVAVTILTF